MNLICIPYAGGNRFSFKEFYPYLEKDFKCISLELPGHGKRINEALLNTIPPMVEDLYFQLLPYLEEDYFLYGHSMGGFLGNELIHYLNVRGKRCPLFFLATGSTAPRFLKYEMAYDAMSDQELLNELEAWGGIESNLLENKELMDFFLPIIRADLEALQTYQYQHTKKHCTPITLLTGESETIEEEQIRGWQLETSAEFESSRFEGGHFFIFNNYDKLAVLLRKKLKLFGAKQAIVPLRTHVGAGRY